MSALNSKMRSKLFRFLESLQVSIGISVDEIGRVGFDGVRNMQAELPFVAA